MNGSVARMYVDGSDISFTKSYTSFIFNQNLELGKWTGQTFFDGLIDDVRIYNRVLSALEIRQLFANPFAVFQRGPTILSSSIVSPGNTTNFFHAFKQIL